MKNIWWMGAICVLFAGCATALTPAQEKALKDFDECRAESGAWTAQITEIREGGSISFTAHPPHVTMMSACMTQKRGYWDRRLNPERPLK